MENSDAGFFFVGDIQLSLVCREAKNIPETIGKKYGKVVKILDLSSNELRSLNGLYCFENLEELILDNNQLGDDVEIPAMANLHTLTLNKNNISNLDVFLDKVSKNLPSLKYLSLLSNQACPNELSFSYRDEEDYQRYRYYVLHRLPNLKFLDSRPVQKAEKREAQRVGAYMKIVAPSVSDLKAQMQESVEISRFTPLPSATKAPGKHRGTFGRIRYSYSGKNSEGNRFIKNAQL